MKDRAGRAHRPKRSQKPSRKDSTRGLVSVVASLSLVLALVPAGAFATDGDGFDSPALNVGTATGYATSASRASAQELVSVTYSLDGLVSSNSAESVSTETLYRTTLSLADGMYTYVLPSSITVKVGGEELAASEYAYNSDSGELIIYAQAVTGDIAITAAAEAMTVTVPTVTAVTGDGSAYSSGDWSTDSITYTVSGSTTTAPRGINNYQYSTNGGSSWLTISLDEYGVGTLAYSTSGNYTLQFRACARVNTTGNQTTSIYSDATSYTYMIDSNTPTIGAYTADSTTKYLQSDTVTISAWAGPSQAAAIEVSKDGGDWEDITDDFSTTQNTVRSYSYTGSYTVTESGAYTFRITNGAGASTTTSITYGNIDSAQPVVELDTGNYDPGSATTDDVTVTLSNATANLGTTAYKYSSDGGTTWESLDTVDGKATLVLSDVGTYSLLFIAVSESGVVSETVSLEAIIEQAYTWEIPVEIAVEQGGSAVPPAQDFALEILGLDGEAIDLDAIGATIELSSDTVATDGTGDYTATLTFTGADDAYGALSDGFILRLMQGDAAGWVYDDAAYEVCCWFDDDGAQVEISIADAEGINYNTASFTCTYTGWTLAFETNGGSGIDTVTAADGTAVDLGDYTPTKDGYTFVGWYADEGLNQAVESVTLTADTTVYAGWEKIWDGGSAENATDDDGAATDGSSDSTSTLAQTGDIAPAALAIVALLAACLVGLARAKRRLD